MLSGSGTTIFCVGTPRGDVVDTWQDAIRAKFDVEVYEEIGICKELTKMMGHCFTESGHWGTWCESAHADIVQGESEDLGCTMTWYGARSDDAPLFPGSTDSGDDASSSSEKELNTQEYAYYDSLPTPGAISPKKSLRAH